MNIPKHILLSLLGSLFLAAAMWNSAAGQQSGNNYKRGLFAKDNLVAWCIIPYDAEERGPEERAQMLNELGIKRMAWDWRQEHLKQLPREIETLRRHNIELSAAWLWIDKSANDGFTDTHNYIFDTLDEYDVSTTIWMGFNKNFFEGLTEEQKIEKGAAFVKKVYERAKAINCDVAFYNHGNWIGDPENQVRIIREIDVKDIGIVYNFHHAHHQIERFPELLETMMPYLKTVNLNGMDSDGPKILPIGEGTKEAQMLRTLMESDFSGTIGILDHDHEVDSKERLKKNMEGLQQILDQIRKEKNK